MTRVKVAAYARVSTNNKDQRNSFKNQKDYFEKVARESEIYELVEIYADEGISGIRLKKRDSFLRMIYDAGVDVTKSGKTYNYDSENNRVPKFKKILIKDISRFSRNLDTIPLFRALCAKGVSLVLTNMGMEFSSDQDELNLSMLLTFAQHESVDKSKKVRFGLQRSAEKGVIKMSKQLYGYNYDPEKKEITIVEEEAKIVQMIFDLYVNKNMGVRRIMQRLKDMGIKTRSGKDFGYSTLSRMIANRKYCGDMVYLKYDSGTVLNKNSSHVIRPEDEWVIHENVVDAIIPREMFNKAQELRGNRAEDNGTYKGRKQAMTEYSNLVVCGNCGAYYGRNKANGEYLLNCMTKKRFGVKECDYPNFKVKELDLIIKSIGESGLYKSMLYEKNKKIKFLNELKIQLKEKVNKEVPPEYHIKKQELENLRKKKDKLLPLYLEDKFDKKTLDDMANDINTKIVEIENDLWVLSVPLQEIDDQVKNIDERIKELSKLKLKKIYSKDEVISLIEKIQVEHVFRVINLTIKLKVSETIAKALDTLNLKREDVSGLLTPTFYYSLQVAKNVPTRYPEILYALKPEYDPEKVKQEISEDMEARKKEFEELTRD